MHVFEMLKHKVEAQRCEVSFAQDHTGSSREVRPRFEPGNQPQAWLCVGAQGATATPQKASPGTTPGDKRDSWHRSVAGLCWDAN